MSIRSISRPQGLGRSFTAGTALRCKGSFDYGVNPFTFSARIFRPSATSGSHAILSFGREDDAYAVMRLLDNALAVECGLDFSVSYPAVAASSPIPYGRWCTVSAVFDATEIRIYVDGVSAGSVGLTRNDTHAWSHIAIGELYYTAGDASAWQATNLAISAAGVWSRALSTAELIAQANGLSFAESSPAALWLLDPSASKVRSSPRAIDLVSSGISPVLAIQHGPESTRRGRFYSAPSAGGGATIAGALESLTLSTFGATVGSARAVAAALESLALTTSAARVSSDRAITASVESISITTSPARIASDRAVAAATEQLTVTPATASVALVSGIAAGTEALSVTANPATVALAASIAATLEAITVTGLTATVSTSSNTNISAALESITVTVNPATVSRNTALAAALESLTVTPHAASIAVGQIVAAALESLTLTSYPAGIALDVAIAAQLEQINLTTLAAQVGLGTNVAALTEALTLTPHGATLTFAPSVGAATEYITLTTFAAVVGATEAALLSPGLEFTIPLSRLGYTIPLSRVHFTIPQE